MTKHSFIAAFEAEDDVIAAVRSAREHQYQIEDVFTPYAVHGLDEAMGLRPSRLTWACLAFAMLGLTVALWLQHWTSTTDWPLNVGGKPFNSLPAFVPVAFELTVLFAGLGTVATLFARCRLFPGKPSTRALSELGATDDKFVLQIAQADAAFDSARACELFRRFNATWCGEIIDGHLHPLTEASAPNVDAEIVGSPVDVEIEHHPAAGVPRRKHRVRETTGSVRD